MARMIPESLSSIARTTAGERRMFDLLEHNLPPECIVRYEMQIGLQGQRPDYCIVDPRRGVLIIEVKDYGIENVVAATQEQFRVKGYGGSPMPIVDLNPDLKCQYYLSGARQQMIAMRSLRSDAGALLIPSNYFVSLTNITNAEFEQAGFGRVMPREQVLLKEDLANQGTKLVARYCELMPELAAPLTDIQLNEIQQSLFPDTTIPRVTQGGFIPANNSVVHENMKVLQISALSLEQEQIAKGLGEGPRLLRGIAGTGKTLIMLYRAKLCAANEPNSHTLVLCWNSALANYMRQAYDKFMIDAKGKVEIYNFTGFVRQFARLDHDAGGNDDWITSTLNERQVSEDEKYDAVYVDEAQDFESEWLQYIFNNLIKGEAKQRNFIIAGDDVQCIYKRKMAWEKLGIPFTGRSKILRTIYRNSARVWIFSAFLVKEKAMYARSSEAEKLKFAEKGGYDPQLIECKNLSDQIDHAIKIIQGVIKQGYAAKNVLILYRHRYDPGTKYPLVEKLMERLKNKQIQCDWIAEDTGAKKTFDWAEESVKISTVHSAKGMDSPIVIIIGAETFDQALYKDSNEVSLMYVAQTRAQEFLVILYSGNGGIVPQLLECQKEYQQNRDRIISLEVPQSVEGEKQ